MGEHYKVNLSSSPSVSFIRGTTPGATAWYPLSLLKMMIASAPIGRQKCLLMPRDL